MHNNRDHAWSVRHITTFRLCNMDSDILYKIDHTSGENGFPLQVGEELVLPNGNRYIVKRRELRYIAKTAGIGTFTTTAYLDIYVTLL